MFDKLRDIRARYEEIAMTLAQPDATQDQARYRRLMREHSELTPLIEAFGGYESLLGEIRQAEELLSDPGMAEMAREELKSLEEKREKAEADIKLMLLPRDPNEGRNVVLEIRPAAGGEESALFGGDLLRMYQMYAGKRGFKMEILSLTETELGGVKEVSCLLTGKDVYARTRFESGVHRVQRVPDTESGGRIHTSTVTVAIMPEAEDVEIDINPNDLRIDTYRAGGAGGQHVNRTDSAVRITHLPSGVVVQCQNERSQLQNRETAMRMLRTKLYDMSRQEQDQKMASERRGQVGTGDRSERIRTYNFPQGRVTDHRIGLTLYQLSAFMEGDCDEMIDALILADQTERLKASSE